jgi:O-antigen/teichoic acid export membrane protein
MLLAGTVTGVMTARLLGPTGKGVYATILMLSTVFAAIGGAGIGEAAIVRIGQGAIGLRDALGATIVAVSISSLVASLLLLVAGFLVFQSDWSHVSRPVFVAGVALPAAIFFNALLQILNATERIVAVSILLGAAAIVTTMATVSLVAGAGLGVPGAIGATAIGTGAGLAGVVAALWRAGLRPSLKWLPSHIKWAFGYGAKVQSAYLAGELAARFDLVLVTLIIGARQAGFYSVALTVGALVATIPWAVSYSTFPRIAALASTEAHQLAMRACRLAVAAALLSAALIALAAPVVVPLAFGRTFAPAVGPALAIIPGGVTSSIQALLGRALAARGQPGTLLLFTSITLAAMCALDLIVIRPFGILGAGIVSTTSSVVGLGLALQLHNRHSTVTVRARDTIPHLVDFRDLAAMILRAAVATRVGLTRRPH